jgi:shikimate kinase
MEEIAGRLFPNKNMRAASSGGTMVLALLAGQGRLYGFRLTVSAVVNDELSPAVTRSTGTESH